MTTEPVWRQIFPELAAAEDASTRRLRASARLVTVPAGQPVFYAGSACENYLLVVSGTVRVQVTGEGGREVVLYRVGAGQSCVLTTSCMLAREHYPAAGFTETEVQALAFARADFDRGLDESGPFRRLVFANLGARLADVIQRMEEVAFQPVDRRLAAVLLSQADAQGRVIATHQDLAVELGTAREVVSRHLKRLENRGLVRLGRSSVALADADGLAAVARGDGV